MINYCPLIRPGHSVGTVAPILLRITAAQLFLPSQGADLLEGAVAGMRKLIGKFLVVAMLVGTSVGALAQKRDDDKRPQKQPAKVVVPVKRDPPPQNSNRSRPPDNKKKPN